MAYIYKHIRKDTNEVFYIGIGSKKSRAYSMYRRNEFWKKNVNKTDYIVEIVEDNLSWQDASDREKYWIKFYGRRDLNEGTLVNLTNGGEGSVGIIVSEQTKQKMRESRKFQKFSEETKKKISQSLQGKQIRLGAILSEETKQKISNSKKGKPLTVEHKLKLKGRIPWNKKEK